MSSLATESTPTALSVTELTAQLKLLLEGAFPDVWVTGEVSNFSRPSSGHCYFTLKDDQAQIRAVMWRGAGAKLPFNISDGMELICRGSIDLYAPRGSYQIVVDQAFPKGVGGLELALRKLKEKLQAEGLFDPARKRRLPRFPRRIGFVTSPTGAAVLDFLKVLSRRWRGADVLIIPTRVQGAGAAEEIAAAIEAANRVTPALDVLVVGRGGGSVEDLWSFNEEPVIRALAASRIPTISAVGHEVDVTLADLAADLRALTPSEAAELVVPSVDEIHTAIAASLNRLHLAMRRRVERLRSLTEYIRTCSAFARPLSDIHARSLRLDELEARLTRAIKTNLRTTATQLRGTAGRLETLSPLATLTRGYSVVQTESGLVVKSCRQLSSDQRIVVRVSDGSVTAVVE